MTCCLTSRLCLPKIYYGHIPGSSCIGIYCYENTGNCSREVLLGTL